MNNRKVCGRRQVWQACSDCGKERWVGLAKGQPIYTRCHHCATKCKNGFGEYRRFKGTRGYIYQKLSPDDFYHPMVNCLGYVLEHRLIMARHLGRCLDMMEIVHHQNNNKEDNRLENLVLLSGRDSHLIDPFTKSQVFRLEQQIKTLNKHIYELTCQLERF